VVTRTSDFTNLISKILQKNGGWSGLWNSDVRIAEMDREGIAAEVITSGDGRFRAMGYEPTKQFYPLDLVRHA
jgi:hypothetical protein